MSARRDLLVLGALLAGVACWTSPPPEEVPLARSPRGITATIYVDDGPTVRGELLAVTDSTYVLASNQRVGFVRFRDIDQAELEEIGPTNFRARRKPSDRILARARLYSRFPYGIPDTAITALLAGAKQTALADFARP